MKNSRTKTYIFYEIGDSCSVEFKMKKGRFHPTEDAVVIGISKGQNFQAAFKKLQIESPWVKEYKFDTVVAREIGKAIYL
ncbi:MAG: hypothetical protein V3W31_08540 [Thermodesulfobacteriota bacterium]